jgi:hypothetical protein
MDAEHTLAPLFASIIGVVALANHFMTKWREHEKKLVELRVEHLIECWRKIEHASLIAENSASLVRSEAYDGMDDAIARITLLGTKREIEIANSVVVALTQIDSSAVVDLLNELRGTLRKELGLEQVPKMQNEFFRMRRDKE